MCSACGCVSHYDGRRFLIQSERVEKLKDHVEELRKEFVAVEACIKELSS